jgi:hypothetical protein
VHHCRRTPTNTLFRYYHLFVLEHWYWDYYYSSLGAIKTMITPLIEMFVCQLLPLSHCLLNSCVDEFCREIYVSAIRMTTTVQSASPARVATIARVQEVVLISDGLTAALARCLTTLLPWFKNWKSISVVASTAVALFSASWYHLVCHCSPTDHRQ